MSDLANVRMSTLPHDSAAFGGSVLAARSKYLEISIQIEQQIQCQISHIKETQLANLVPEPLEHFVCLRGDAEGAYRLEAAEVGALRRRELGRFGDGPGN